MIEEKRDGRITNRHFALTNIAFRDACDAINLAKTLRQASKWRRKVGLAYTLAHVRQVLESAL
jgi:hypothetical protein